MTTFRLRFVDGSVALLTDYATSAQDFVAKRFGGVTTGYLATGGGKVYFTRHVVSVEMVIDGN